MQQSASRKYGSCEGSLPAAALPSVAEAPRTDWLNSPTSQSNGARVAREADDGVTLLQVRHVLWPVPHKSSA
jgi:hypothetical protein